jgi:peptide/nickel transport system substrate-binding protein
MATTDGGPGARCEPRPAAGRLLGGGWVTRRRVLWGAGLGAAALVGNHPGRVGGQTGDPTTFVIAAARPPTDLDPHSSYDPGSGMVLQGAFESLIRLAPDGSGTYEGAIAEAWEANADQSVWTFHIRDGVTFHDGTPCDAAAVRASFERLLTLNLAASGVLRRFLNDARQITASDARTVVFDLGRPQPIFEAAIASPYGTAIVNAALAKEHETDGDWGYDWAQNGGPGLGTGPYRIERFDPGERVELSRYDGYWRGWAGDHFASILVRIVADAETRRQLVEQGDADLVDVLPIEATRALESNPEVRVDRRYTRAVTYLIMTVAGPLADPVARQALCWAFPYDDVIEGVYEGTAKRAIGPVAELCRGFDPAAFVYQTDQAQARALLVEAGVAAGTNLRMMVPNTNPTFLSVTQLFAANLEQVGIDLSIETVAVDLFLAMLYGDMPAEERPNIFPFFWAPDYDDAWNHLWPQLSCDAWNQGNAGQYCNPQVEDLLGRARDAADPATYQAALSEVQQLATRDDPAAIYFAQAQWTTVVRRNVVGYNPHPIVSNVFDLYALHRAP